MYSHKIALNADRYTVTDHDSIPTGCFQNVVDTGYDFRVARNIGQSIANISNNGFDDNFCVTRGTEQKMTFVARLELSPTLLLKLIISFNLLNRFLSTVLHTKSLVEYLNYIAISQAFNSIHQTLCRTQTIRLTN